MCWPSLELLHLVSFGEVEYFIELFQGLALKVNLLLVVESQEVFKSLFCCILDHNIALLLFFEIDSRPKEGVLEVVAVQGEDEPVEINCQTSNVL